MHKMIAKFNNSSLIVMALLVLLSCQSKIPTKGLVLHLPTDQSKKVRNQYTVVGAQRTKDRFGLANKAYLFDGVDDQIIWMTDSSLNNLPISFSFWISFNEFNSSVLGNDINDNYQTGVWFSVGKSQETQNKIAINFGNGKTPPGSFNRKTFTATKVLELEEWYHIVGIVESINSMKIFINGVQSEGSYSGSANFYSHSQHNGSIGRAWDSRVYFNGAIDDFRIYSRSLTSDEVSLLFAEH